MIDVIVGNLIISHKCNEGYKIKNTWTDLKSKFTENYIHLNIKKKYIMKFIGRFHLSISGVD